MSETDGITVRELADSVAVVTGGNSGIGLECAAQLAEAGVARLVLAGRDRARGEAAVAAVGARAPGAEARFFSGDLTDPAAAAGLAEAANAAFGRVDVLINCVGGNDVPRLFHDTPLAEVRGIVARCLCSALHSCRAVWDGMAAQRGGVIVNFASDAAKLATPGETVIGASLAGILMFTRALAVEGKRVGIRANCLTPSIVRDTALYDRLMAAPFSSKLFSKAERQAHLGVVTPRDIAPLVVFLAGPSAAKLTGQGISVNGGISAA
jgi:NAD(P)-dependent dehydrogenase (short-subunit alcohol dehydrogenase family)